MSPRQRRLLRRGMPIVALMLLAALAAPRLYKTHVEARFKSFMRDRLQGAPFTVRESRCLGDPAQGIRLRAVATSRYRGTYPYLSRMEESRDKEYMQQAYFHGYWFNYCKLVQVGQQNLIAYWSLKEDRWQLGQLGVTNGRSIWQEWTVAGAQ